MSDGVDAERSEMSVEFRLERSKRIRRQQDDVVRLWLEGLPVTLIAQRLGTARDRVYFLMRVLELVNGSTTRPLKPKQPGHLYNRTTAGIDGA